MTETDVDLKSVKVLEAIKSNGGEGETGTIREIIGAPRNQTVLYRFEKLDEAGLVDVTQPDHDGGRIPAKVASLTDDGREFVDEYDRGSEAEQSISERMDDIDARLNMMSNRLEVVENALGIDEPDDSPKTNLRNLQNGFVAVERYLVNEANADLTKYHPDESAQDD